MKEDGLTISIFLKQQRQALIEGPRLVGTHAFQRALLWPRLQAPLLAALGAQVNETLHSALMAER